MKAVDITYSIFELGVSINGRKIEDTEVELKACLGRLISRNSKTIGEVKEYAKFTVSDELTLKLGIAGVVPDGIEIHDTEVIPTKDDEFVDESEFNDFLGKYDDVVIYVDHIARVFKAERGSKKAMLHPSLVGRAHLGIEETEQA